VVLQVSLSLAAPAPALLALSCCSALQMLRLCDSSMLSNRITGMLLANLPSKLSAVLHMKPSLHRMGRLLCCDRAGACARALSQIIWMSSALIRSASNHFPGSLPVYPGALDEGAAVCCTGPELPKLPRLRHLNLLHCNAVDDRGLESVARGHSQLRSLQLRSDHISDAGLATAVTLLTDLQRLELVDCEGIRGDSLAFILPALPNLQVSPWTACFCEGRAEDLHARFSGVLWQGCSEGIVFKST
jgi:hypothetical protein